MRNQSNISDVECSGCAELLPCNCPADAMQLWGEACLSYVEKMRDPKQQALFEAQYFNKPEENLPATLQLAIAHRENRKYDVLRIERGSALKIFDYLGSVQGTLFRLQKLYLGSREMQRQLQGDIARSIDRLHLIVGWLTPAIKDRVES